MTEQDPAGMRDPVLQATKKLLQISIALWCR